MTDDTLRAALVHIRDCPEEGLTPVTMVAHFKAEARAALAASATDEGREYDADNVAREYYPASATDEPKDWYDRDAEAFGRAHAASATDERRCDFDCDACSECEHGIPSAECRVVGCRG